MTRPPKRSNARLARAIEDCAARLRASWKLASGDAEHEVTIDVESALDTLAKRVRAGEFMDGAK